MARNRQRASDRKRRNLDGSVDGVAPDAIDDDPNPIHRSGVSGEVEHTGEVDRFEAGLVAGAEGEVADDIDDAELERAAVAAAPPPGADDDEAGSRSVVRAGGGSGGNGHGGGGGAVAVGEPGQPERKASAITRFRAFLRASWAELQRVQWPDRRQVGQATAVVLGFVVIAGAFLGLADVVAERIVDFLI